MRRAAPGISVVRSRVALGGRRAPVAAPVVVSVGLAGGLSEAAQPGAVIVPTEVVHGEQRRSCDARWSEALASAAQRLGHPPLRAPLLTSDAMLTGIERERWAALGFVAVDMESGLLGDVPRLAAVRVVLDAPGRELSPRWRHPLVALLDPACWGQAVWLVRHAPAYARRAAQVLASALAQGDVDPQV